MAATVRGMVYTDMEQGSHGHAVGADESRTSCDGDLAALALGSAVAELDMSLESMSNRIFEIQELRHASWDSDGKNCDEASGQSADNTKEPTSISSERDAALRKLEKQVTTIQPEVEAVNAQINGLAAGTPDQHVLKSQVCEINTKWKRLISEVDSLRDGIAQDKYLAIYRTVSKQAEGMMTSLEKVFAQCHTFIHDINSQYGMLLGASPSAGLTSNAYQTFQDNMTTFIALHRSLHQKSKYYLPSCERVLQVIDSGMAQQKTVSNEVEQSHLAMKARWRNVDERIKRVEAEMESVQEMLSLLSERWQGTPATNQAASVASASSGSPQSTLSTPSRSRWNSARTKSLSQLTPSPPTTRGQGSPTESRATSPYRKVFSRVLSRTKSEIPHASSKSISSPKLPNLPADSAAQIARLASNGARELRNVSTRPTLRQLMSEVSESSTPQRKLEVTLPTSNLKPRSVSAFGIREDVASAVRPRWNASTRVKHTDLSNSLPSGSRPRKSLPNFNAPGSFASPDSVPPLPDSRNYTPVIRRVISDDASNANPDLRFRAPSPTLSTTSNVSASSAHRHRMLSPSSRIPAPNGTSPRRSGRGNRSGDLRTQIHGVDGEAVETLSLRPTNNANNDTSTLMSRVLSPTPTTTSNMSRRRSHIPRLSVSGTLPVDTVPDVPAIISVNHWRESIMTPEPAIRNRAVRASALYGGTMSADRPRGRPSLGLPASSYGSALSNSSNGRPAKTSAPPALTGDNPQRRPLTPRQSYSGHTTRYIDRSSTPMRPETPLGFLHSTDTPMSYIPNPVDPLDVEIARIVSTQIPHVHCQRIDLPLNKAEAAQQKPTERYARYIFGFGDTDRMCKLVDRGPERGLKVLVRVAANAWQDLEAYLRTQQQDH